MTSLRIATWNIGGGFVSSSMENRFDNENLSYFASELEKLNGDVICLQEVHLPISPHQPDQATRLNTFLNLPFREIHACDSKRASHLKNDQLLAIALLSQFTILHAHYVPLSNPALAVLSSKGSQWLSHDKGFLQTTLQANGVVFDVVTGHNVPFRAFKRDFMEPAFIHIRCELEDLVLASAQARPTILIGDLNYEAVEQLLPRVFAAGFSKALSDVGTEPIRGTQIDHILVSEGWEVIASGVIEGKADHFLCYADLVNVAAG